MESDNKCEWAITLSIFPTNRKRYNRVKFMDYIKHMFRRIGYIHIVIGIEETDLSNLHAHVYFYGTTIYWLNFNKDYKIGYVKNRVCYNVGGWIDYCKKWKDYFEDGTPLFKSPIERFTGESIEQCIMIEELSNTTFDISNIPDVDDVDFFEEEQFSEIDEYL